MKKHPNMSDDEWNTFLAAIPKEKKIPIGNYDTFLDSEGVTEEDIRWWNSMSVAEQNGLKRVLQTQNAQVLVQLRSGGMAAGDALIKMHKAQVIYDDYPLSEQHIAELEKNGLRGGDYPLPWQLSDRIGRYMGSLRPDTETYQELQERLKSSTSANAMIRQLIREGVI